MMWKTVFGRCIYHIPGELRVSDNGFFRWLHFASPALQTLLHKKSPEKAGLYYIPALIFAARNTPGNTCLLGLGGAGVAHALSSTLKNYQLSAIEYNPSVIKVAKDFFFTDNLAFLNIIHKEASLFIKQSNELFQHIIVDLFTAHSFPDNCLNPPFFINCRNRLLPGGILSINLANPKEHHLIFSLIKQQFGSNTIVIPIKKCTNLVILAINDPSISPIINTLKTNDQIKKLIWDDRWGYMAELKGC